MPSAGPTKIERSIFIRAPRSRVWRAISDAAEFGRWFRVEAEGQFTPGARVRMTFTHAGCTGVVVYVTIERMVPEQSLSWHWEPGVQQVPGEPPTRVEFRLEDAEGGTRVTVE